MRPHSEVRYRRETRSTECTVRVWLDGRSRTFPHDKKAARLTRCCAHRVWKSEAAARKQNNRRHHPCWSGKTGLASKRVADATGQFEKPWAEPPVGRSRLSRCCNFKIGILPLPAHDIPTEALDVLAGSLAHAMAQ